MANNNQISEASKIVFASTYIRLNGQPLEETMVWNRLEDAQAYALTPKAYVGQIITVNENDISTVYVIQGDGTLKTVGQSLKVEPEFFESIY